MSGEAEVELHDKYVLVNIKGDPLSPEEIKLTLSKAAEQANESRLSIIINREVPVKQRASIWDFLTAYAETLARVPLRNKLALVFPEEMHDGNLDFFETASRNRAINARLLSNMEEALKWIGVDVD